MPVTSEGPAVEIEVEAGAEHPFDNRPPSIIMVRH
jgi:hypothetical protein